jgi:hypothetical protein
LNNGIDDPLKMVFDHAALRRRNFFFGSVNGGRFGAVLLTLAFNYKLLGINAWNPSSRRSKNPHLEIRHHRRP